MTAPGKTWSRALSASERMAQDAHEDYEQVVSEYGSNSCEAMSALFVLRTAREQLARVQCAHGVR